MIKRKYLTGTYEQCLIAKQTIENTARLMLQAAGRTIDEEGNLVSIHSKNGLDMPNAAKTTTISEIHQCNNEPTKYYFSYPDYPDITEGVIDVVEEPYNPLWRPTEA